MVGDGRDPADVGDVREGVGEGGTGAGEGGWDGGGAGGVSGAEGAGRVGGGGLGRVCWLPKLALTIPLPKLNRSSLLLSRAWFTLISFLLPPTMITALPTSSALSILLASSTCLSRGFLKVPVG